MFNKVSVVDLKVKVGDGMFLHIKSSHFDMGTKYGVSFSIVDSFGHRLTTRSAVKLMEI